MAAWQEALDGGFVLWPIPQNPTITTTATSTHCHRRCGPSSMTMVTMHSDRGGVPDEKKLSEYGGFL